MSASKKNKTDDLDHMQTNKNDTIPDMQTINMDSKLADDSIAEFCDKTDLKIVGELSLCFNRLSCIPINFSQHLSSLERLDISNNILKELPSSFNLLIKLEHLKLDQNEFQLLPKVLGEIRSLKTLSMSHNKIEEHLEELSNLINLETLDLRSNNLSQLPYSFIRLNRLRELNLAENKLAIIPECVVNGMRNLEFLDLSLNKGIKLNVAPCSRNLRKFYAMKNGTCKTFPRWLFKSKFSTLEEINFNGTEFILIKFPKEKALLNLRNLSITQSTLSDHILEQMIRNMIKLEIINIGNYDSKTEGNIFWNLPVHHMKNPQLVKEMYMPQVGLSMITGSVGALRNITIMDIGTNRIGWLPDEFCLLQKLEVLIIENNGLTVLPENFGNLVALKEFIANRNHLSTLPASVKNLKELRLLDLFDNEFTEMSSDVINLENLQSLDVEYNFFSADNLMIKDVPYEVLRKSIRERCMAYSQRSVGAKDYPQENNDCKDSVSSVSSKKSEFYREPDETQVEQFTFTNDSNLEEKWSSSEDSTEDFDPNSVALNRNRFTTSMVPSTSSKHFFCPADHHAISVREHVAYLQDDAKEWGSTFEEGQFDDAE